MKFGEIIRHAREQNRLSQEEAAKSVEKQYDVRLSASYLSMIENGSRTNLTVNLINALLDFFKLPMQTTGSLFHSHHENSKASDTMHFHEAASGYHADPTPLSKEQWDLLPYEAKISLTEFAAYLLLKYIKQSK